MELQAMKSGRRTRDEPLVERLFDKRQQQIAASPDAARTVHLLDALVADFKGLRDVSAEAARAKDLSAQPDVRKALARERSDDDAEGRMLQDILELETGLTDEAGHAAALLRLQDRLKKIASAANAATDSPERSRARRVLRSITAGAAERVQDREYHALLEQYGMRGRGAV
jgi:hypothetical protein